MKADVYERVTAQIVAALENGVRPWHQPWNAAHAAGRIASSHGRAADCPAVQEHARRTDWALIPGDQSGRKVIGPGRLYLHSAPSQECREKDAFIVTGDLIDAYVDSGSFSYITKWAISDGEGDSLSGWVETSRLAVTGTGIGPAPEPRR